VLTRATLEKVELKQNYQEYKDETRQSRIERERNEKGDESWDMYLSPTQEQLDV